MLTKGIKQDKNPATIDEAYLNLSIAIIERACDDYRKMLKSKHADADTVDVVKFFRSEWFKQLTNVDGERLMKMIEKEMEE